MKRILLLLLPLALAFGVWFAFFQKSSPNDDGLNSSGDPVAEGQGPTDETELLDGSGSAASPGEEGGLRTQVAGGEESPENLPNDPETEWLEGRVTWPADYTPEGEIWVYALPQGRSRMTLDLAILRQANDGHEMDIESFVLNDRKLEVDQPRQPLAQVKAGKDGRFRIPLPAWRPNMHLQVLGRHLYRDEALATPPLPWGTPVELDAQVGVWVLGQAQPGEDAGASPENSGGVVRVKRELDQQGAMIPGQGKPQGIYNARMDDRGQFEFRGLPPEDNLVLNLFPTHYGMAEHRVGTTTSGQSIDVEVALDLGQTWQGTVVSESDEPIPGAMVLAYADFGPMSQTRKELRHVETAADGSFSLANLPEEKLMLQAFHPRWLSSELLRVNPTDKTTGLKMILPKGASIKGRTELADGTPLPGAAIVSNISPSNLVDMEGLGFVRHLGSRPSTKSDDEGNFVLEGLAALPYVLEATVVWNDTPYSARIDAVRPSKQELVVVLGPIQDLTGRVENAAGEAVVRYTLSARRMSKGTLISLYDAETLIRVDHPEGAFTLPHSAAGTWELMVQGEMEVLESPVEVLVPRPAEAPELVLITSPARAIQGTVVDPLGQPFEGATIRLQPKDTLVGSITDRGPLVPTAQSGPDGKFSLGPLPMGNHGVQAGASDYCPSVAHNVDLSGEVPTGEITLQLREGATLTGEVIEKDGSLGSNRMIAIVPSEAVTRRETTSTDSEGKFSFEHLEPGTYQVVAMGSAADMAESLESDQADLASILGNMQTASADLKDGEATHVVLGTPPANPVLVKGQVTLAGEPVPGGFVSFSPNGKSVLDNLGIISIGEDGRFELTLDGGGRYRVTVQRVGGNMMEQNTIEFVRDIPQEDSVELDLALPEARVSGMVKDASGQPAASTRVSLFSADPAQTQKMLGGSYVETRTKEDGSFDITGLLAGNYYISAGGGNAMGLGGGNSGESASSRVNSENFALEEGMWKTDVQLKLVPPGSLLIKVVDSAGAPVSGASIFVRDSRGRPLEAFSLVTTSAAGTSLYEGLGPGSYTVSARTKTLATPETGPIEVKPGETQEVTTTVQDGTVLRLIFKNKEGDPSPASIRVLNEEGHDMASLFGVQDMQVLYSKEPYMEHERRLGPLAPGRYRVMAEIEGIEVEKSLRLRGEASKRFTLRAR